VRLPAQDASAAKAAVSAKCWKGIMVSCLLGACATEYETL
jgi:hypothetical protein